ncbi:VOC family protein [Streptomyces purpurogeneiscleroticus]|uniref:VOC family protein n=1 Tax=Streptomyces purpurogeneiscleroticus TaxID=68259 RepID=UPI001CBADBF2|nr:VOC family protein [Streptomyces purpurogeneiscleroticus]MBZ4017134.1 glyoxalase [Streptomyces purpurogeneiscleroticus]
MPAIPGRYRHAVVPHLMIDGAAEAMAFYAAAFGAEEIMRIARPDGRILHAEMRIQDSVLMVGDGDGAFRTPREAGGTTVGLHVYVDDVDTLYRRAVAAGTESLQPPTDMFYGDRTVMLKDPFGHVWVFLTQVEELSPEEVARRGNELLQG